jgi:hypothetical protein
MFRSQSRLHVDQQPDLQVFVGGHLGSPFLVCACGI